MPSCFLTYLKPILWSPDTVIYCAGIYLAQRLNPEKRLEYVEAIRNIGADEDNDSVSSIEEEASA